MMLKTSSTFGNFAFAVEAEVDDTQMRALAAAGLLQILQRTPASDAEKKLAGYDKRPAGFLRGSIAFSEASAAVLKAALESAKVNVAEEGQPKNELALAVDVTVTEHTPGAGAESKWIAEKAKWSQRKADGTLAALAANVGYAGLLEADGAAPQEFLVAIRAKLRALAAAM